MATQNCFILRLNCDFELLFHLEKFLIWTKIKLKVNKNYAGYAVFPENFKRR